MSVSEEGSGLVRTTVDLPKDIVERIDNLTEAIGRKDWKRKGQSRMATMREMIDLALPEMEKEYPNPVNRQGGTPTSQPAPRPKLDINPADIDPDTGFLSEDAIVGQEREAAGVGDE